MSDRTGEIVVKAYSDMACQIVWSDDQGAPVPVGKPARAEVRDSKNTILVTFDDDADPSVAAVITATETSGVVQLTAPRTLTRAWTPGRYAIDVFATVADSAAPFASGQYRPVMSGWFVVEKATTIGNP